EHEIRELLNAHHEWFLAQDGGPPLSLATSEFDFSLSHRRLIFSCWTETGSRMWRVAAWNWNGEKLVLQATRRMGAEVVKLELVPRASAKAIVASIAAARQARCEKLAQIVAQTFEGVGGRVLGVETNIRNPKSSTRRPEAHPPKSKDVAGTQSGEESTQL